MSAEELKLTKGALDQFAHFGRVFSTMISQLSKTHEVTRLKEIISVKLALGDALQIRNIRCTFESWCATAFLENQTDKRWHLFNIIESSQFVDDGAFVLNNLQCAVDEANKILFSDKFDFKSAAPKSFDDAMAGMFHSTADNQQKPIPKTTEEAMEAIEAKKIKSSGKAMKAEGAFTLNLPLAEIISGAVNDYIDSNDVLKNIQTYIKEEAKKLRPTIITIGDRPAVEISGRKHHAFENVLKCMTAEGRAFLVGPTGTGKTTLAQQAAEALKLNFGHLSCSGGMSEGHILGRMNADGEYLESEFVSIYENGGLFLFDEVDAADPNTLLTINSGLANNVLSVPNRAKKRYAHRHKDFYCICAANTYGTGSGQYSGRARLDDAFLDRFVASKVFVDYDRELEFEIAGEYVSEFEYLVGVRSNIKKANIKRALSTRAITGMVGRMMIGDTFAQFLDIFFLGWSEEEKLKATAGLTIPTTDNKKKDKKQKA